MEEGGSDDEYEWGSGESEDAEYEGNDSGEDSEHEAPAKPRSAVGAGGGMYRLPSKEEQLQLHNTDTLMKSNLLRLQTDELLAEVGAAREFEKKRVLTWLVGVEQALKGGAKLMSAPQMQVTAAWLLESEGISVDDATGDRVLHFAPPASVEEIGSFVLKTSTAPLLNIDVAVEMPPSCFEMRDVLNGEYFFKRNLYVGAIWSLLLKNGESSITPSLFKGDSRKPLLVLRPTNFKSKVTIRLIPVLPINVFKLTQLRADKNNVRPESWLKAVRDNKKSKSAAPLDPSLLTGTPYYNLTILEDIAVKTQFRFLQQGVAACPVAKDIIVLLKVWLTQRSMRFAFDSFDGHHATLLVAYLLQIRRITNQMTPLAGLQVVIRFLAETSFSTVVLDFTSSSFGTREGDASTSAPLVLTHPLLDASAGDKREVFHYNCMWRVKRTCLDDLVEEARKSQRYFDTTISRDAFNRLFMSKSSFFDRHDLFFHIPFSNSSFADLRLDGGGGENSDMYHETVATVKDALCDYNATDYLSEKITSAVTEALGNRVSSVRVILSAGNDSTTPESVFAPQWTGRRLSYDDGWVLSIGLVLHKEFGYHRVERGPSAEDIEAGERFRKFWGPAKSKLRRFQDGSIIEAVVWDENKGRAASLKSGYIPRGERIVEEIIRHVLARHVPFPCGGNAERVICKGSYLEQAFLPAPGIIADEVHVSSTSSAYDADTLSRKANEALDALRFILISKIKDLPLVIENVMATSAMLRYTALIPPQQHPLLDKELLHSHSGSEISLLAKPLLIAAKIESGGKWPTDPEAIANVKTALYLRLGELLAFQFQLQSVPHKDSIDIMSDGFIFRLQLFANPEVERNAAEDLAAIVLRGTIAPMHHNAIKALHSQFPSFGNAVRLLSRWCAGNHFTGMASHEVLELVTASCYLDPVVGVAPSSPSAGFRRALLKLTSHDWENEPLIVDFADELSIADRLLISSTFQQARESASGPALFIVSSYDRISNWIPSTSSVATPSKVVLRLLTSAAMLSLSLYDKWARASSVDYSAAVDMMEAPAPVFANVTLRFSKSLVSVKRQSGKDVWDGLVRGPPFARLKIFSNTSARETALHNLIVKVGSSSACPVQEEIVDTLRREFDDVALFFWNGIKGNEVGIVWKPAAFLPDKFKILRCTNRIAVTTSKQETLTVFNATELVTRILAAGEGALDADSVVFR